jgi:integrase
MPLTDIKIRNAKPGPTTAKMSDGEGLQLWLSPVGGKVWHLAYRHDGRQKKLRIGPYPAIGLSDARAERDAAKGLLARGIDPVEHAKAVKGDEAATAAVEATTFGVVADELLAKKRAERKAAATLSKLEWLLGIAKAGIGSRPIASVKPSEVLDVLRSVEAKGHHESARRLRSLISEVFRFAIATSRAEIDAAAPLVGALITPQVTHRAAITTADEFGGLLRAIDAYQGQAVTRAALQLMALLAPRPGELRQAEWSELDFAKAVWTIPASRAKTRREHKVPLPPQALEILEALKPITGQGRLLLPGYGVSGGAGRRIEQRPLSENTLNAALRRLGFDAAEASAHGFRSSFSTLANESGQFAPDVIEAALAHVEANAVRRAYARGQHWPERVRLAAWWADEIDRLRALKPGRAA